MIVSFLWKRYGLIAELAYRFKERQILLTEDKLRMLIYLSQEIFSCIMEYEFDFQPCGLYCSQIDSDLAVAEHLEAIRVEPVGLSLQARGYAILPGERNEVIRNLAKEFLVENSADIDKLIDEFGNCTTWELTVVAKLIYVLQKTESRDKDCLLQEAKDKLWLLSQEDISTVAKKLERVNIL